MVGLLKPASQKSEIRRLGNQPTDNPGRNPSTPPNRGLSFPESPKNASCPDRAHNSVVPRNGDGVDLGNPWACSGRNHMKIVVLDDYQGAFRTLSCFARLAGHEV